MVVHTHQSRNQNQYDPVAVYDRSVHHPEPVCRPSRGKPRLAIRKNRPRRIYCEPTFAERMRCNRPWRPGWETGERNLSLTGQLYRWYEENSNLGKAFDSSTGFILPNGATSPMLLG